LRKAEDSIRDVAARQKVPADVRQPADPQKKSATRLGVALNPPKEEGGGDKLADSSARSYSPQSASRKRSMPTVLLRCNADSLIFDQSCNYFSIQAASCC
jgi:hypothetical protein